MRALKRQNREKTFYPVCLLIAALGLVLIFGLFSVDGRRQLQQTLLSSLVAVQPVEKSRSTGKTLIYVLGGSERSLNYKFQIAADLYHAGFSETVTLLSVPGITAYDTRLKRNPTYNELAIQKLMKLGVPEKQIKPITLKQGFFGTLSEARGVREAALTGGYKKIILITSAYHTRRTLITFLYVFKNSGLTISIYAAPEPMQLYGLIYEYLKLVLYEKIVLPLYPLSLLDGRAALLAVTSIKNYEDHIEVINENRNRRLRPQFRLPY